MPKQGQMDLFQEKKQDFPRVLMRFFKGKVHMSRIKESQQTLNDGNSPSCSSSCNNLESKHLDKKKRVTNPPQVGFKEAYIKIPRLSPKDIQSIKKKYKQKLTPTQPKLPPSEFKNSLEISELDGKSDDVSDISLILTEHTKHREDKFINKINKKFTTEQRRVAETNEKFNQIVERIMQSTNNNVLSKIDQDEIIQNENLLNRSIIEQLVNETASMQASGTTKTIPIDKILIIFNVMELNIRGGEQISFVIDEEDSARKEQMVRVLGAADACLVCLYVMTSPNMPKRIYLEDVINRLILCIEYQLENIIFPAFDSSYVVENKKTDGPEKKSMRIPEDSIKLLYNKILKLINLLTDFVKIQLLTDTLVLRVSSMAISSCFVKNIEDFQPACLKLIKTIFIRYEKHRRLMLEQLLTVTTRLCSTKSNLCTHKFGKENIDVPTVLVLQLIQCVTSFPENLANDVFKGVNAKKVNKDNLICNKYEKARNMAATFLTMFLNQCTTKSEDTDYKPLFENFIQDLLLALNKPKWPASVLLLNLLRRILVKKFSDKETEIFSRVACLDYLGTIMAWLKKGAILMQYEMDKIDQMVTEFKGFDEKKQKNDSKEEKIEFLQEILLDFLAKNGRNDQTVLEARQFYLAQWYSNVSGQITVLLGEEATKSRCLTSSKTPRKRKRGQDGTNVDVSKVASFDQNTAEIYHKLEARKKLLLNKLQPFNEFAPSKLFQDNVNYYNAELIARYLVIECNTCENVDQYLTRILLMLKEPEMVIKKKVLKCLSVIIEADLSLLTQNNIQLAINSSFLDSAPSVREAAVDLIGKFILNQPDLFDKYYDLLSTRILDTNACVRKRVIQILRDICIKQPNLSKIPEICVKMIHRVNDEGSIGKLVVDAFQSMWFTLGNKSSLLPKVLRIVDVVAAFEGVGLELFEQLLENLFKPKEDKFGSVKIPNGPPKVVLLAFTEIVDCLVKNILKLKETHSANLVSSSTTLYLFAKIQPQLLVKHAQVIQPLLHLKYSQENVQVINNTAQILALVVPLIPNHCQTFLAQLEQDCLNLVILHDRPVVISCLTCFGAIINNVTRSFNLVRNCFVKYYNFLVQFKEKISSETDENMLGDVKYRQYFKRALFVVGLLFQHFDFNDEEVIEDLPKNIINEAFEVFLFYLQQNDKDIQVNAIKAVGCFCTRHCEFIIQNKLKDFYQHVLASDDASLAMKSEVLINIESYLVEEDQRMIQEDVKWQSRSKLENLKEMDDISSGMASMVIQEYLKVILESYLNPNIQVRNPALRVVQLILRQGLVHPVQIVPYLICMSTDCEIMVSHGADKQLLELQKKYPELIHTKASLGIKLSYQLQKIVQDSTIIKGFRSRDEAEYPISLNGYLYSLVQSSRQQRRGLVLNMLKQFDEEHISLSYMLYLADNIAYFPYVVQDEPLFIIHHIDMIISVSGSNLLQSFREGLTKTEPQQQQQLESSQKDPPMEVSALDEDDDKEGLLARLPEDTSSLQAYLTAAQGCLLLLILKQHLKNVYGFNDGKIQQYSPVESAKIHDKPINRRSNILFNPTTTINKLQEDCPLKNLNEEGRKNLINQYLEFKQLMLKLDREDNDEKSHGEVLRALNSLDSVAKPTTSASDSFLVESEQVKSRKRINVKNKGKSRKSQTPRKSETPKRKKRRTLFRVPSDEETENESSDSDFVP